MLKTVTFDTIDGMWILIGTCGYIVDKILHNLHSKASSNYLLHEKRQIYFEGVK